MKYIRPGSDALVDLNSKEWTDMLPMFRVLYGVGGLTFGSNKEYGQNYASIVIPDALYAMVKNVVAQLSHDEIDNPAYWNNVVASGVLGLVGGLSLTDQGSILIPHWSGAGEGVAVFDNNPQAEVVKVPFAANENVSENYVQGISIFATAVTALVAANALDLLYPGLAKPTRMAIGLSTAAVLSSYLLPPTVAAVLDMTENHENPSQADWQEKQKSKKNLYSKIPSGSETVESYLLEDFLYEKPFVNLAVYNDNDWTETVDSTKMDSLGLYGADGSLAVKTMATVRSQPLKFSSSKDWNSLGVKVDRWSKVVGADGDSIPIRHVERYNVPAITVDNWIEKYSFVVDDLMPHRLRQIRMNFNYQEEIAWECDITKPEISTTACTVYKRSGGGDWDSLTTEKHPVKKNGQFDFVPADYGYNNLLAIQKDNQNTVTISTVNKIGLSNTQRFLGGGSLPLAATA
ncbi:MAG: hypothetical protein MJY82_07500 [Fibrobacter sp.]|nr:hypothetical protein [Fibrobacter sp.]